MAPCYTSEIFTNLRIEYNVNHITSSPHYPQSNGLAEKYVQIVKSLFHKAKEEGKDLYKCLVVYHNTLLSSHLQSPMQILASRSARSNLPMSNAARRQKGLDCKHLRTQSKNEQVPSHDLHLDQVVMYQDPNNKKMLSSHHYKIVPRTKKLPDYYQNKVYNTERHKPT